MAAGSDDSDPLSEVAYRFLAWTTRPEPLMYYVHPPRIVNGHHPLLSLPQMMHVYPHTSSPLQLRLFADVCASSIVILSYQPTSAIDGKQHKTGVEHVTNRAEPSLGVLVDIRRITATDIISPLRRLAFFKNTTALPIPDPSSLSQALFSDVAPSTHLPLNRSPQ